MAHRGAYVVVEHEKPPGSDWRFAYDLGLSTSLANAKAKATQHARYRDHDQGVRGWSYRVVVYPVDSNGEATRIRPVFTVRARKLRKPSRVYDARTRRNPHGEGPYTHFVVQPDTGFVISGWWNAEDARDAKNEWDPGYRLKVLTRAGALRQGYDLNLRKFKRPA